MKRNWLGRPRINELKKTDICKSSNYRLKEYYLLRSYRYTVALEQCG